MAPVSWRDVFDLLETHRRESKNDHQEILAEIDRRVSPLERDYLLRVGESQGEQKIKGMARSTLAIIISVGTAVGTLVISLTRS